MLPCEGGFGQVFGGGGGANGDRFSIYDFRLTIEFSISRHNIRGDVWRDGGFSEESANGGRSSFERGGKRGVCILESGENLWLQIIGIHKGMVCIRCNVESIRDGESSLDHFCQRQAFAANIFKRGRRVRKFQRELNFYVHDVLLLHSDKAVESVATE